MKKIKIIITTLLMLLSINVSFGMGMWGDYTSNNNFNDVYDNMGLMNNENFKTVEFDEHMNNYNQDNPENAMNSENNNKYWPMNTNIWSQLFSNDNREINTLNNHFLEMGKEMDEHQNEFGNDMMDENMGFDMKDDLVSFNNYNTDINFENNGWGMMR